jgi:uncharacterized protein YjeT (DUF2065 family)
MANAGNLGALLLLFIGLYYLAVGIGALTAPANWAKVIAELQRSPFEELLGGLAALVIGATLLIVLRGTPMDLPGQIVRVIGVMATIKGLVILALPGRLLGMSAHFIAHSGRQFAYGAILIGVIFIGIAAGRL